MKILWQVRLAKIPTLGHRDRNVGEGAGN